MKIHNGEDISIEACREINSQKWLWIQSLGRFYRCIKWQFKSCYSLNVDYTVIRLNDPLKHAMDILAVERR